MVDLAMIRAAIIWVGLALGPGVAIAQEVTVIAHPDATLTPDDVRNIFLGEKQFVGQAKLVPIDNAAVQDSFVAKALRIDPTKYGSVWMKKSFREGLNPPPVASGDAETIAFVKSTPGAVGYVMRAAAGVSVIGKF